MIKIKKIIYAIFNPQFIRSYLNFVCPLFEISSLLKKLDNIGTIIDIGSNKGQFLIIASYFFPKSALFSFEPQKKPLQIQKKILKNKKISFFNIGIGEKIETKKFYVTNREDSSSFLKPDINTLSDYNIKRILKIKIDKLDNCLKNFNFKKKFY